ncbi:MAG: BrnT family toxin [Candidatus Aminicenantes bacterium]|nr:BrnT family toxin [Candidatus Aminicenantes bacterium]NIM83559.1 BrnT family toxin [Candidatus Aminicenantes bacterium]NIN22959.1 BrnT family toxin [Candidatus Aminicenantes bacterium]NIN46696.1 BrnT family toxin [Candidatus Aminicenantes bacterium]NIN89602.1 BrnT family toxin [Candidatus Aminicenantes bacterium]
MMFEFDLHKSESNKKKHGIDFVEAQNLWDDPDLIEIPAKTVDEPRFLVVGKISGRYWSGIITYRGEKIRIISVRRSRKEEVQIYES